MNETLLYLMCFTWFPWRQNNPLFFRANTRLLDTHKMDNARIITVLMFHPTMSKNTRLVCILSKSTIVCVSTHRFQTRFVRVSTVCKPSVCKKSPPFHTNNNCYHRTCKTPNHSRLPGWPGGPSGTRHQSDLRRYRKSIPLGTMEKGRQHHGYNRRISGQEHVDIDGYPWIGYVHMCGQQWSGGR